jgi:GT2 family glycosyltransferase
MRISVVILCYNEQERIAQCLDSLAAQDHPREDFEVLVVDNGSTDATVSMIQSIAPRLGNLRLLTNPRRGIAPGRNLGIREAAHPFVAFTDADCILPPDWLSMLARGWERHKAERPSLAAVGGTNRAPDAACAFYDAVNVVLKTPLGNRNSTQGREFGRDQSVDHIPTLNVMYDRDLVLAAGGFDEDFLFVCEDPDLNYRMEAAGHGLIHLDGCGVVHAFRPGFGPWARKVFGYGQGRTQLLRKHPRKFSPLYLVPPFICCLYGLALAAPFASPWLAAPLAGYLAAMTLYTAFQCLRRGKPGLVPQALWLYLLTHAAYGLGQFWGLWRTPAQSFKRRQVPGRAA